MDISSFKKKIERLKGKKEQLEQQVDSCKRKMVLLRREKRSADKAQILIQFAAQKTQESLKYQLTELPKLALKTVFGEDAYDFDISIEIKRSKTEVDFWFVRDGMRINPKDNTGLGAVDIAGMALRPALWSLRSPRNRPCILLDEPFKHLKGAEPNKKALAMLKEITIPRPERNWPGMQIIMVADERASREDIIEVADKLFDFKMKGRETKIKEII